MILFKRISDLRTYLNADERSNKRIGFVPTMGALHAGHLNLIIESKAKTDITVCSIFINPTQFNDPKDFQKYPVTIEKDIELLETHKCDILFLPSVAEMYPEGTSANDHYDIGELERVLEGEHRPGHFQGVCRIVDKLLTAVQPHELFMGQKDFQQCMVIQQLLKQKFHSLDLNIVPTMRETDGLAMSSRNMRLSDAGRKKATIISQVLQYIVEHHHVEPFDKLISEGKTKLLSAGFSSVDYLEICIPETLQKAITYSKGQNYVVLTAAFLEEIRLIDNMLTQTIHS